MARTKTSKTTDVVESTVTAPVPIINVAAEATAPKTIKKTKAVKETVAPVAVPTPTPTPVIVAPVEENVVEVPAESDSSLIEQSTEFLAKLGQLSALISSLKTEYRVLEKKWTRELKTAQKQSSKRKRKAGNRAPSGFVKPTRISDELATFLGKEKGAEMARTAVTRDINTYIRNNNLQDEKNGRKINPDA
jgi:hypothetical protein